MGLDKVNKLAPKIKKTVAIGSLLIVLFLIGFYYVFPGTAFQLLVATERNLARLTPNGVIAQGLWIEYLEGGKGDTVVLLHGFGADKDNWNRFGKYLTPHLRVIAPDLPGFGESSADPDMDYSIEAQVDRVKAFLKALGVETFHLGGSSMGGSIAGAYAARYPQDVKSLLLIAPGGVAASEPSQMLTLLKQGEAPPLIVQNRQEYDALLDFVFYEKPFIPGVVKWQLARQAIKRQPLNAAIWKQLEGAWGRQPLESALSGLEIPTLIVWGTEDRVLHVSGAEVLEAVMPRAQVALLEAVGHLPMVEKPGQSARLYLRFLNSQK
jgi:abhydrolase domain-containing protein 6